MTTQDPRQPGALPARRPVGELIQSGGTGRTMSPPKPARPSTSPDETRQVNSGSGQVSEDVRRKLAEYQQRITGAVSDIAEGQRATTKTLMGRVENLRGQLNTKEMTRVQLENELNELRRQIRSLAKVCVADDRQDNCTPQEMTNLIYNRISLLNNEVEDLTGCEAAHLETIASLQQRLTNSEAETAAVLEMLDRSSQLLSATRSQLESEREQLDQPEKVE